MTHKLTTLLAVLILPLVATAEPHDVFGTFATEDGGSHIAIADCGDGSPCGTVVWIDPASLEGDMTPEMVKTRSSGEPILGVTILSDFEKARKDWREGTIYSPEADKTYDSRLKRSDSETLEVKGCIGIFCQTQIWTLVR